MCIRDRDILLQQEYEIYGYNGICNIVVTAEKDIYNRIFNNSKFKGIIICLLILNLVIPTIVILLVSYSITNRLSLLTIHLKKVKNGEFDTIGAVSYTHLDVYKRQSFNWLWWRFKSK